MVEDPSKAGSPVPIAAVRSGAIDSRRAPCHQPYSPTLSTLRATNLPTIDGNERTPAQCEAVPGDDGDEEEDA
uniref:Uncharacterized protein n=1 Tax=Oryza sativa subsp. japonica TaxID=39947 RepID=Q8H8V2_ORYSJ|nr:hypothetical protein [Oryza sativa Japonica Group]